MDDFSQQKIVYREISIVMEAAIVPSGWFINNKLYMITGAGKYIDYICGFLNSKLFTKLILPSANFGGGKGIDFLGDIKLPIQTHYVEGLANNNDLLYYHAFKLTEYEIQYIANQ